MSRVPWTSATRALEWALQQEGLPYDKRAILGFASGRDWRTEDAWFCSEARQPGNVEVAFGFHAGAAPPTRSTPAAPSVSPPAQRAGCGLQQRRHCWPPSLRYAQSMSPDRAYSRPPHPTGYPLVLQRQRVSADAVVAYSHS